MTMTGSKGHQWIIFLSVSLFINLWLFENLRMDTSNQISYDLPSIKVNLLSIAAPIAHLQSSHKEKNNTENKHEKKAIETAPKLVHQPDAQEKLTKVIEFKQKENPFEKNEVTKDNKNVSETYQRKSKNKNPRNSIKKPIVASLETNTGKKISTTIHEAKYRSQIPPVYPRRAYELGQEGIVILLAEVSINGKPSAIEVEESSGYRLLDSAALAAVKKWEFEPIKVNEQSIVSWVRVPVRFVIQ